MGRWFQIFAALAVFALGQAAARADDVEDFYKGKQINLDPQCRGRRRLCAICFAFAPFFSAHIPGRPNIVVQNMPGGGGLRAMGYFISVAPRDGTTLGLVHSSVPFAPLYGIKGAHSIRGRCTGSAASTRRAPSASPGRPPA